MHKGKKIIEGRRKPMSIIKDFIPLSSFLNMQTKISNYKTLEYC
jgi:hypothetical protein